MIPQPPSPLCPTLSLSHHNARLSQHSRQARHPHQPHPLQRSSSLRTPLFPPLLSRHRLPSSSHPLSLFHQLPCLSPSTTSYTHLPRHPPSSHIRTTSRLLSPFPIPSTPLSGVADGATNGYFQQNKKPQKPPLLPQCYPRPLPSLSHKEAVRRSHLNH